jgi:hypothetical protein
VRRRGERKYRRQEAYDPNVHVRSLLFESIGTQKAMDARQTGTLCLTLTLKFDETHRFLRHGCADHEIGVAAFVT